MHMKLRSFSLLRSIVLSVAATVPGTVDLFAQALLDVRNPLPGSVDAPVYLADGVTRLDSQDAVRRMWGTTFLAQLFAGPTNVAEIALAPVGSPMNVGTGEQAGYWDAGNQPLVELPGVEPGATVFVQVRVWEVYPFTDWGPDSYFYPILGMGASEVFTVRTDSAPVPLRGLSSFSLEPPPFSVRRDGNLLRLEWTGCHYSIEQAPSVAGPWTRIDYTPPTGRDPAFVSCAITQPIDERVTFYRLTRPVTPLR
jgi:hypothetical protein